MAEGKTSFVLYADYLKAVELLPDGTAGQLFKTILRYVNDLDPQVEDLLLKVAFEPIKNQLKRDLKAWEGSKDTKSLNGRIGNLKRWSKELYEMYMTQKITLEEAEIIAKDRKASQPDRNVSQDVANIAVIDNVNVNVNDTVNVIVTDKEKKEGGDKSPTLSERKKSFEDSLKDFEEKFGKETILAFSKYWTEHSEKGKKMRFEKETVFDKNLRLHTWKQRELNYSKKNNNGGNKQAEQKPIEHKKDYSGGFTV